MIRVKKEGRLLIDVLSKIGVFSVFLLLSFFSVVIYSPVLKSDADSTATTEIGADVKSVASISHSSSINLELSPTSSGKSVESTTTLTVRTNSNMGYDLYVSSTDESTDMVSENGDIIKSNFNGKVKYASSMPKDNWGWSIVNLIGNYRMLTKASEPVLARSIDYYPPNGAESIRFSIAAYLTTATVAGTYTKDILFTLLAHTASPDVEPDPTTLQEFQCLDSYLPGRTFNLVDTRDSQHYTVEKYPDGSCWITSELRIKNATLTEEDSDITGEDFILPDSNWSESHDFETKLTNPFVLYTNTPKSSSDYHYYYNYAAATAGTVSGSNNTSEVTGSICPKGWRMPTYKEFKKAYDVYSEFYFPGPTSDAGQLKYDEDTPSDDNGWYYSSSNTEVTGAWVTDILTSSVDPSGNKRRIRNNGSDWATDSGEYNIYADRANGFQVYCVARDVPVLHEQ